MISYFVHKNHSLCSSRFILPKNLVGLASGNKLNSWSHAGPYANFQSYLWSSKSFLWKLFHPLLRHIQINVILFHLIHVGICSMRTKRSINRLRRAFSRKIRMAMPGIARGVDCVPISAHDSNVRRESQSSRVLYFLPIR